MLVDSHCHLQDSAFDADRDEVLARSLEACGGLVVAGDDLASSRAALPLTGPRVRSTAGVHPHHADTVADDTLECLRCLFGKPGVAALGEIGLDYHYDNAPRPDQRRAFERQLALALELGVPIVVHSRSAEEDTRAILDAAGRRLSGVMHCFSGGPAFAESCLALGLHISFAGNVTFPRADDLRAAARTVPLDRLLVETDAPYLAPQPVRGNRCEPAHARYTAQRLAEEKCIEFGILAAATARNAARVFGLEI